MTTQSSDNSQTISKILDAVRMAAIVVLLLHFYFNGYSAFKHWGLTNRFMDRILHNLVLTKLFQTFNTSKITALIILGISLMGSRGKKDPDISVQDCVWPMGFGLSLYFSSPVIIQLDLPFTHIIILYIILTSTGFLLIMSGATRLSRIVVKKTKTDIFNLRNQSFPQEERLIQNDYSINIPAQYRYKDEMRASWINIINPFRGIIVLGSTGAGKTYFIIQHIIKQQIQQGFSMLIYDFKYDNLSRIAYNYFLSYQDNYPAQPSYYNINFDDLEHSHRCNALPLSVLNDITDAREASRAILVGLNMDWASKSGDFFVESPINFLAALIWFLRNYRNGKFCTLPHVIELAQIPYRDLFSILRGNPQTQPFINPFINAFLHGAMEQLEGQIASATISLANLSSPRLYYILSGDDFTLDLNDPEHPKILTLGNNPEMPSTRGAVLSVYINTITRLNNRKRRNPLGIVLDEFSTIIANSIDRIIATGRENRIATTISAQDISQLQQSYGKSFADVVLNVCGNLICGNTSGETAKMVSERFAKTMQDRESISINSSDLNITQSLHLEQSVPASRLSSLTAGEFVGIIADNPDQPIRLKAFCSYVINDHQSLTRETATYEDLPVIRELTEDILNDNYFRIRREITLIVQSELARMRADSTLRELIIQKK